MVITRGVPSAPTGHNDIGLFAHPGHGQEPVTEAADGQPLRQVEIRIRAPAGVGVPMACRHYREGEGSLRPLDISQTYCPAEVIRRSCTEADGAGSFPSPAPHAKPTEHLGCRRNGGGTCGKSGWGWAETRAEGDNDAATTARRQCVQRLPALAIDNGLLHRGSKAGIGLMMVGGRDIKWVDRS